MSDWPKYNTKAWLRLPCCNAEHPTRIEDLTAKDDCVIAAPQSPHTSPISAKQVKKGFFIGWVRGQEAVEAPVSLIAAADEPIPTWTIKLKGKLSSTTRRRYVRVDFATDVTMYLLERGAPTRVQTRDLSEGGFSCEVDEWANDPQSKVFHVELLLEGITHTIRSQIAWWGRLNEDDKRSVGVQFIDVQSNTADQVRSFVFSEQLRQRRLAQ